MQFLVIGYDGKDEGALDRRLAAREEHLKAAEEMYKQGSLLFGVAIKDEEGKMVGSTVVVEFSTREELDDWLEKEPYVTGGVWKDIEIKLCQVPPFILDK